MSSPKEPCVKTVPELIDEDGNIQVHGRQDAVITLEFNNDDGTPEDVSGKAMTFECGTEINLALTNGSSTNQKVLTLTNATIKTIYGQSNKAFVVLDDTKSPRWVGAVYVTGWVE